MQPFRLTLLLTVAAIAASHSQAQATSAWQIEDSGVTASLRGIYSVDGTVAWASGAGGTVLKTADGGAHWQPCAIPDAEKDGATLDLRGVQAWDSDTAIVMASGPGEKSRLYKTTDGCKTWALMLKNTDPEGFYDTFTFWDRMHGFLLGDPVLKMRYRNEPGSHESHAAQAGPSFEDRVLKHRRYLTLSTVDGGAHWAYWETSRGFATEDVAQDGLAFAASNSAAFVPFQALPYCQPVPDYATSRSWIGLGGKGGARILMGFSNMTDVCLGPKDKWSDELRFAWSTGIPVPMAGGTDSSGIFSVGFRGEILPMGQFPGGVVTNGRGDYRHGVAVGGDYSKPNESAGTAAWSADGGEHWTASATPPHGYRSTVQWSEELKLWIAAGTNGSDVSRDDGKTWQPLDNGNWNAISLPFIVGPKGRIGRLDPTALPKP